MLSDHCRQYSREHAQIDPVIKEALDAGRVQKDAGNVKQIPNQTNVCVRSRQRLVSRVEGDPEACVEVWQERYNSTDHVCWAIHGHDLQRCFELVDKAPWWFAIQNHARQDNVRALQETAKVDSSRAVGWPIDLIGGGQAWTRRGKTKDSAEQVKATLNLI